MWRAYVFSFAVFASSCSASCATSARSVSDLSREASPAISVSGVMAIEKSPLQIQRDEQDDKAKAVSDDQALSYSRWSMIGTCMSAAIAIVQALFFFWQLSLMRRSTNDAAAAARAAQLSAEVARDTFTQLERPWIFLEGVRMRSRDQYGAGPLVPNNVWLSLQFKNNGRSPALITGIAVHLERTTDLPEVPDYSRCNATLVCPAALAADKEFETNEIGPAPGEDVQMTLWGRLTYSDVAGVEHHTGFAIDFSQWMPASSTNKNRAYDHHD